VRRFAETLLFLTAALGWAAPAWAEPEVSVTLEASPTEARVGELMRLEVRVSAKGGSIDQLELEDLHKYPELEIVRHNTVRPMSVSFGFGSGVQVESSLSHVYVLRPSAPGEYRFSPAVAKVDGKTYRSQPLTLLVTPGAVGSGTVPDATSPPPDDVDAEISGARFDEKAFVRTIVEPREAYVGQQINVTVYLYTRLRLGPQSVVPSKPAMDGFWVYDDPVSTLQAQTASVRGARYQVYALHRSVAFPQRTGELTIGAPSVSFDVGGLSFFDAPQRVEREGVPVEVDVKPLPAPGPANAVVGRYQVRARLDRNTAKTGDAVTLRVDATGIGNVQDLRIDLPPIVGVRALQPAIRDQQRLTNGTLSGTRTWEWILIAEAPGEHLIPPLGIDYFDPETAQYGRAATPEVAFQATGAPKPSRPAFEPASPRAEPTAPAFGPISMYSALRRGETPIRSRAWFAWLLAMPPLGFALLAVAMSLARRREQRSTTSTAVQRKLVRGAHAALESDDPRTFYDRIVAAVTHALDVKLGEPVGGLPHAELRTRLSAAGFDEDLIERVVNELEGADFARFAASGVDKDEMERCLQRTNAIIERVQRTKGTA
jgi:hypothetical protein